MLLVKALFQFVLAALAISGVVLILHIDVNVWHNGLTERSATEIIQASVLLIIASIHFSQARRNESQRQCNVLVGGFFLAMLFRELDGVLDIIFHGSWFWFALIAAIVTIGYVLKKPAATVQQLIAYIRMPSYGVMFSGLLAVLVFSRLFGMSILWQAALQDEYVRVVKNMVEEGTELFGYVLCFIATLIYLHHCKQTESVKSLSQPKPADNYFNHKEMNV